MSAQYCLRFSQLYQLKNKQEKINKESGNKNACNYLPRKLQKFLTIFINVPVEPSLPRSCSLTLSLPCFFSLSLNQLDIIWYLPEGREPTKAEWEDSQHRCLSINLLLGRELYLFLLGWVMDENAITDLSTMGVIHSSPTLLIIMNAQFNDINYNNS